VGDIVKIPQSTLLRNNKNPYRFRRLDEPEYGFIVEIINNSWPVYYEIVLDNDSWILQKEDFIVLEE